MQKSGASVRNGSRLCENSRVHFARRKFFSIWSICKPKLLTTAIRGRQKRNRFYALLAHARFHGPGSTAVHPDPVGNRQRWVVTRHSADRRGPTRLPRFPPFASSHLRIAGVQHVSDAVVARRLVRVRCRHVDDGTVLKATFSQPGYVLIAAISGPGPMMLMTRVRL